MGKMGVLCCRTFAGWALYTFSRISTPASFALRVMRIMSFKHISCRVHLVLVVARCLGG